VREGDTSLAAIGERIVALRLAHGYTKARRRIAALLAVPNRSFRPACYLSRYLRRGRTDAHDERTR
jgi:hypothetical protein